MSTLEDRTFFRTHRREVGHARETWGVDQKGVLSELRVDGVPRKDRIGSGCPSRLKGGKTRLGNLSSYDTGLVCPKDYRRGNEGRNTNSVWVGMMPGDVWLDGSGSGGSDGERERESKEVLGVNLRHHPSPHRECFYTGTG